MHTQAFAYKHLTVRVIVLDYSTRSAPAKATLAILWLPVIQVGKPPLWVP